MVGKFEHEKYNNYKEYKDKLKCEYKTSFEKIELYFEGSSKLNAKEKNNCLLQILDTFLSGQEEGKTVVSITGRNLRKYCDDMIYGESVYAYKASRVCDTLIGALFYIMFMDFSRGFFNALFSKKGGLIPESMSFGIGDFILVLGYICIPKLISVVTRNYFEDPVRCKRVKRLVYWSVWIFTFMVYSFIKDTVSGYEIIISFNIITLVILYSIIVYIVVGLLMEVFYRQASEDSRLEKKRRLIQTLTKEYNRYKGRCERRNRNILDWERFIRRKAKKNVIFTLIFFLYALIFLVFTFLITKGMLIHSDIDMTGFILLIVCCLLDMLLIAVVREGILRNKQLVNIKAH